MYTLRRAASAVNSALGHRTSIDDAEITITIELSHVIVLLINQIIIEHYRERLIYILQVIT